MGLLSLIFARGEQERSDELDAQLRAHNAELVARGKMTPEQYQVFEGRVDSGGTVDEQMDTAFVEGAKEGLAKEQAIVKSTLTETLAGAAGFIPWWLWIVAGVALVLWAANTLGVFQMFKRKIANA